MTFDTLNLKRLPISQCTQANGQSTFPRENSILTLFIPPVRNPTAETAASTNRLTDIRPAPILRSQKLYERAGIKLAIILQIVHAKNSLLAFYELVGKKL